MNFSKCTKCSWWGSCYALAPGYKCPRCGAATEGLD